MNESRRNFLRKATVSVAGLTAFPLILKAAQATSNKLTVGLVGCDYKGINNLKSFLKHTDVECTALYDINHNLLKKRAFEVKQIQNSKPKIYHRYEKLLDDKNVDVVINSAPANLQGQIALHAMQAGKDLYTEKPLFSSVKEGLEMIKAQKYYKRLVQVAYLELDVNLKSKIVDVLSSGKLGKIQKVNAWSYQDVQMSQVQHTTFHALKNGRWNKQETYSPFGESALMDKGTDYLQVAAQLLKKSPKSVMATGSNFQLSKIRKENPDVFMAFFDFGDISFIWDQSYGMNKRHYNRNEGFSIVCEAGAFILDHKGLEVLSNSQRKFYKIDGQNTLDLHTENFLNALRKGEKLTCDPEKAFQIAKPGFYANHSYNIGKRVFWDSANDPL